MKVLSINKFYYLKGGAETCCFNTQKLLEKHGHQIIPFSMADKRNADTSYSRFFVSNIDYRTKSMYRQLAIAAKVIYSYEARNRIRQLLDVVQPDIAHLHNWQHQLSPSILPELKSHNVPVVYTVHDYKPICPNYKLLTKHRICECCLHGNFYHCLINKCTKNSVSASLVNMLEMYFHRFRRYYELIDVFLAPSAFLRGKMIEAGFPASKIVHVPNFIDPHDIIPGQESGDYCLYFGRLSAEKGVKTLVRAMAELKQENLIIAGTGPQEMEIKRLIKTLGLDNVQLVGYKSGLELHRLIENAIFTVLPSQWYENNPFAIIESFAYGKPVIGASIGGIPELIEDNVNGFLFEPKNYQDLADKMKRLFTDRTLAKEMGAQARYKVVNKYSPEKYFQQLISIYNSLTPQVDASLGEKVGAWKT